MQSITRAALFAALIPALSGCGLPMKFLEPKVEVITENCRVTVYGANEFQLEKIIRALKPMTPEMRLAIPLIAIYPKGDYHIAGTHENGTRVHHSRIECSKKYGDYNDAHCHSHGGCVCCRATGVDEGTIIHETGHALKRLISIEQKIRWRRIASSNAYGENRYTAFQQFPLNGIMSAYGATNEDEDLAEWVEAVYNATDFGYAIPFYLANKNDPRYKAKLDFLLDNKFISADQHKKITRLLK